MTSRVFIQKCAFRLRHHLGLRPIFRKIWWQMQGARFGSGTSVPRLSISWPHQVSVGLDCNLEDDIFFKYDGWQQDGPAIVIGNSVFIGRGCEFNIRKRITIGDDCLIASGCKFIDHDHAMTACSEPMRALECPEAEIELEDDIWLGINVVVLKGVVIGRGAVVGAGAVVTRSIPRGEIWAGVPARRIGVREDIGQRMAAH
jgi:acetyltransferase-like isoleucine patch superfamily enzyme